MNLDQLYDQIRSRERIRPMDIYPGMRIGVIYSNGIHVVTVRAVGRAKASLSDESEYVALAKISPGQPAINWDTEKYVHLMQLQYLPEFSPMDGSIVYRRQYHFLQVWEPITRYPAVLVSKAEKHAIWKESPLEKLIDDNTHGRITDKNLWYYQRYREMR